MPKLTIYEKKQKLKKFSVAELRAIWKKAGAKGYSTRNKKRLIEDFPITELIGMFEPPKKPQAKKNKYILPSETTYWLNDQHVEKESDQILKTIGWISTRVKEPIEFEYKQDLEKKSRELQKKYFELIKEGK